MASHSYEQGTCTGCGASYKIVEDCGGECQWCRGWYRCATCHNRLPLEFFTQYHHNGKRWVDGTCRPCRSTVKNYLHRLDIFEAYRIHGKLRRIYDRAVPQYIENHQHICRKHKASRRGKGGPPVERGAIEVACLDLGLTVTDSEWFQIANALNETYRTERWKDLPPGEYDPEVPQHPALDEVAA